LKSALLAVLDTAAVVLAAVLVYVFLAGGFVASIAGLSVRFRTPARTFWWLVIVLVIRRLAFPRSARTGLAALLPSKVLSIQPDAERTPMAAAGRWRRASIAGVGIAAAISIIFRDVVGHLDSVHDYGDPLFSMWRMGWVLHQLTTDPLHLFDANIFYPERLTLTLSDPIILPALMQAPFVAFGMNPVVADNLLFLSAIWLSGLTIYLFAEWLTGSSGAALVAAVVFTCYPYRIEHISILDMQMTHWMPLGLLALHLFVSSGRWRYALAFAAAVIAQLYSSMYYAAFFAVYATVIGVGLMWVHHPSPRRLLLPAAGAALAAVVAAVPLGHALAAAQPIKGDRQIEEVRLYSAESADYLSGQKFSRWWSDPYAKPERALFPGVAPLVLAAAGLAPPFTAVRTIYAAGLVVAFDASRGFNGVVYRYLYDWLPPFRGIRVATRFSMLVGLTLAIFSAYGVQRLLRLCRSTVTRSLLVAALCAGVVVDALSNLDTVVPVWAEPPSIYEQIRNRPEAVLADLPVSVENSHSVVFQYFSLWHWKPMVGGYSGFLPPSYVRVRDALYDFPRHDTVGQLRQRGVTHVTLNCGLPFVVRADCDERARLIDERPDVRLVAETRWEDAPVRIYELTR
jgi:hypothetical protein